MEVKMVGPDSVVVERGRNDVVGEVPRGTNLSTT